jgi:hypothetical protein
LRTHDLPGRLRAPFSLPIACRLGNLIYNFLGKSPMEDVILTEHTEESRSRPEQAASDVHSVSAREPERSQLAADLEAFLARGGNIQEVPKDFRADPPKRPESSYGRGSI